MNPTEHNVQTPSTKTGLFASLRALLPVPFRVHLPGIAAPHFTFALDLRLPVPAGGPAPGTRWRLPAMSWRARTLALLLGVAAAYVAPGVTPAFAARGHVFEGKTIGELCTVKPCAAGKLTEPSGVAVNAGDRS